ncbi:CsbD family protein [Marinoscillum sp.]|uniref:CsbD family protein n=1 Tax=Marinoscillum sp. TaxID=2024838 RepID=UPI003BA99293
MDLQLKGSWNQLTGQLKEKYGELTDDDLKKAEGKAEELIGILQEKTGKTQEQLEEELMELDSKQL